MEMNLLSRFMNAVIMRTILPMIMHRSRQGETRTKRSGFTFVADATVSPMPTHRSSIGRIARMAELLKDHAAWTAISAVAAVIAVLLTVGHDYFGITFTNHVAPPYSVPGARVEPSLRHGQVSSATPSSRASPTQVGDLTTSPVSAAPGQTGHVQASPPYTEAVEPRSTKQRCLSAAAQSQVPVRKRCERFGPVTGGGADADDTTSAWASNRSYNDGADFAVGDECLCAKNDSNGQNAMVAVLSRSPSFEACEDSAWRPFLSRNGLQQNSIICLQTDQRRIGSLFLDGDTDGFFTAYVLTWDSNE
jgi:hypothetical protein